MANAKKILIGCGIGCGALVLIGIGSCVGFGIWLNSPGELLEPDQLLGPDTAGYLEWTLRLEDPGTADFVESLLARVQAQQDRGGANLPPIVGAWMMKNQQKQNEKQIRQFFPTVVAWTMEPGADGADDLHLMSASVQRMAHQAVLADWVLGMAIGWADEPVSARHRGERIYLIDDPDRGEPWAVFVRRGIVFFTTDETMAREAIDRLAGAAEGRHETTELQQLFATVSEDRPLRGAVGNRSGELERLWGMFGAGAEADEAFARAAGATLTGALDGEGALYGTVELAFDDAETARGLAEPLLAGVRTTWPATSFEGDVRGRAVRIDFRVGDLLGWIDGLE